MNIYYCCLPSIFLVLLILAGHATSKFRWKYTKEDGSEERGAFFVPVGKEKDTESWFVSIVKGLLPAGEKFDRSRGRIEEFGDDKVR